MREGACLGGRTTNPLLLSLGLWYVYTEISTRPKLREETGLTVVSLEVVSKCMVIKAVGIDELAQGERV